jgi:hypothetical protein
MEISGIKCCAAPKKCDKQVIKTELINNAQHK